MTSHILDDILAGCDDKPESFEEKHHDKWNIIVSHIVNTHDYDHSCTLFHKGLEILHSEMIPLCADVRTEDYFNEICVSDEVGYFATVCELDKVEKGYYRCVCGVTITDTTYQTQDGMEYDIETTYELISRTKLYTSDVDCIIEVNNVYPTKEEYAELMSNTV